MSQQNDVNGRLRMISLDVLRGIAIVMVLVVHAPWPNWLLHGYCGRLIQIGSHGVDLFFVLSGYLISRLLFAELSRTGSIRVVRFWLRRGFKIWPSYYVAYLSAAGIQALWAVSYSRAFSFSDLCAWPNWVFVQNYIHPEARWFASWSLAIEEHFYTVVPIVLLLLNRSRTLGVLLLPLLLGI
jgi:peptidoglycan/LPS O-acetylase OafA/YrhL